MKKLFCTWLSALALSLTPALAVSESSVSAQWQETVNKARGQTVYFNAWGGSQEINAYLRWANKQLQAEYGRYIKTYQSG